jgi:hypothetical protein
MISFVRIVMSAVPRGVMLHVLPLAGALRRDREAENRAAIAVRARRW